MVEQQSHWAHRGVARRKKKTGKLKEEIRKSDLVWCLKLGQLEGTVAELPAHLEQQGEEGQARRAAARERWRRERDKSKSKRNEDGKG